MGRTRHCKGKIWTRKEKGRNETWAYDLYANLGLLEADITFGQLVEISLVPRKTLGEGMLEVRSSRRVNARVAVRAQYPGGSYNVKAIEIEDTIMDKVVPNVLVGNILPAQTMEKLGLSLTVSRRL